MTRLPRVNNPFEYEEEQERKKIIELLMALPEEQRIKIVDAIIDDLRQKTIVHESGTIEAEYSVVTDAMAK